MKYKKIIPAKEIIIDVVQCDDCETVYSALHLNTCIGCNKDICYNCAMKVKINTFEILTKNIICEECFTNPPEKLQVLVGQIKQIEELKSQTSELQMEVNRFFAKNDRTTEKTEV